MWTFYCSQLVMVHTTSRITQYPKHITCKTAWSLIVIVEPTKFKNSASWFSRTIKSTWSLLMRKQKEKNVILSSEKYFPRRKYLEFLLTLLFRLWTYPWILIEVKSTADRHILKAIFLAQILCVWCAEEIGRSQVDRWKVRHQDAIQMTNDALNVRRWR